MSGSPARDTITKAEAKALLPDGEMIHTFQNASFGILGAEWSRHAILALIDEHEVREATGVALAMGHGLVVPDWAGSPLFIETQHPVETVKLPDCLHPHLLGNIDEYGYEQCPDCKRYIDREGKAR